MKDFIYLLFNIAVVITCSLIATLLYNNDIAPAWYTVLVASVIGFAALFLIYVRISAILARDRNK